MKKNILIIITIIIFIAIISLISNKIRNKERDDISLPIDYKEEQNKTTIDDEKKIKDIIEDQGFKTQENIYEIRTEYDGREQLEIKDSIQYRVVISGIIKKDKPKFNEIDTLLNNAPKHTGIWIAEDSRDSLIKILKNVTKANYSIDEEGFLQQEERFMMNSYDNKIKKMLKEKKLFVFSINSECYIVDEVTGEIVLYPFEEIEPEQGYELFEDENKYIFIVNKNNLGKVNQEEVIRFILKNI